MNRTKLYAADATGRSTGATNMTACVVSVLLMPIKMPAATTVAMSTASTSVHIAMTARSTANRPKAAYRERAVPHRACIRGAAIMEKKATSRPDRKSTRLNSSHVAISYAVFCLKKKTEIANHTQTEAPCE